MRCEQDFDEQKHFMRTARVLRFDWRFCVLEMKFNFRQKIS